MDQFSAADRPDACRWPSILNLGYTERCPRSPGTFRLSCLYWHSHRLYSSIPGSDRDRIRNCNCDNNDSDSTRRNIVTYSKTSLAYWRTDQSRGRTIPTTLLLGNGTRDSKNKTRTLGKCP